MTPAIVPDPTTLTWRQRWEQNFVAIDEALTRAGESATTQIERAALRNHYSSASPVRRITENLRLRGAEAAQARAQRAAVAQAPVNVAVPAPPEWEAIAIDELVTQEPPRRTPTPEPKAKVVNSFLVGCDPEFALVNWKSQLVRAEQFWANIPSTQGLGTDHGGRVVELRPLPAHSAYTVLIRLQNLLRHSPRLQAVRDFKWKAGALVGVPPTKLTLGGHVHLDLPFVDAHGHRVYGPQVEALDRVTSLLERLDILPLEESRERRESRMYGQFGDVRTTPGTEDPTRGRNEHWEYRTMASWLYSPVTAMMCLTAAKLAATDPAGTVETIPQRASSMARLQEFFERFKGKDDDADRCLDKLMPGVLVHDPMMDMQDAWQELPC